MRFKLEKLSRPGPELGRVLGALADSTLEALQTFADEPFEKIHTLRTNLKKIQALLRLAKSELPSAVQESLGKDIRILKQSYAKARDEAVLAELFESTATPRESAAVTNVFETAHVSPSVPSEELLQSAQRLRAGISQLPWWAVTRTGINRAFETACHQVEVAERKCRRRQTDKAFHAWRKRVKTVWIQAAIMGNHRVKSAARLAEDLGRANDWANLRKRLSKETLPEPLRRRIERNLAKVRQKALHRGRKIY